MSVPHEERISAVRRPGISGVVLKVLKWTVLAAVALLAFGVAYYAYLIATFDTETLPANYGRVRTLLYAGDGENQPLIVGLGGAEGGNAWVRNHLKPARDRFLEQGYAVLALAYFGEDGIPKELLAANLLRESVAGCPR